ncbi:hypothetical protein CFIO01_01947 [Colletotrichum fioriniae PJ7]|uniref:Uncharacterized protein n=1 Tax=Colletotrichum fioriniae PJ7 TaxID=1445577 RepID=A0A010R9R7_9PEZI|nr:hypothetical protein CFIO01_01947 [Colletotrichum fioriniae PJ7]
MPSTKDKQWDYGIRVGVLTLWDWGGMTTKEICEKYGMPRRTFNAIHHKALARGWGPGQPVLIAHVEDGARSGRPKTKGDGSDGPLEVKSDWNQISAAVVLLHDSGYERPPSLNHQNPDADVGRDPLAEYMNLRGNVTESMLERRRASPPVFEW